VFFFVDGSFLAVLGFETFVCEADVLQSESHLLLIGQAGLHCDSPIYASCHLWTDKMHTIMPTSWLRLGLAKFLPRVGLEL
jgi:hypothetical protein